MDEELRKRLRSLRIDLVRDMNPGSLFDHLVAEKIFTDDQVEEIKGTRRAQCSKLLQDVERRGPRAFPALVAALVETKQHHLAELLQPSAKPRFDVVDHKTSGTGVHDFSNKYKMTANPRGHCLIINNENFQVGLLNRPGSSVDTKDLEDFFSNNLLFSVIVKNDLTAKEIMNELKELAAKDHSKADCCIVFIMSHGKEVTHKRFPGAVLGVDDQMVRVENLLVPFIGDNCPSLTEKPKLFFIQACGGTDRDIGVAVKEDATDGRPVTFSNDDDNTRGSLDMVEDAGGKGEPQVDASILLQYDEPDATLSVPQMADLLVAYSTTPGYVSYRQPKEGSWYVQALLRVLASDADKEDLLSMLIKVNETLSADYQSKSKYKQISSPFMTLRKKLFFHL
uniref:Uncharacterized protein n=1 Tax=Eptatretus burgeri TaxID=7764 RepID=A0A8C4X1H8_EPTBU